MNLCIDRGNSSTKTGIFKDNQLIDFIVFEKGKEDFSSVLNKYSIENCIISDVSGDDFPDLEILNSQVKYLIHLTHLTPVPVEVKYKTPETLGKDRLAAVVGAVFLKPETDLLVIDAGTAITYDLVDSAGIYYGGNIAPGLEMRARSLYEFTGKLPITTINPACDLLGIDTISAIQAGVFHGVVFEIEGYIEKLLLKYPKLSVFLTGGSSIYLENKLKSRIFADKNLVLTGLNRILQYNVR
jgi:type III pantothenate kinase